MTSIKYRPEIDGLRAVAVLAIVFYHAGFVIHGINPFKGGYVGVDVFFVISGYLIASIILNDLRRGEFRFAKFYERRARRLVPALLTVMLASIPFAWGYMFPKAMKEYAGSILSSILYSSNFWFWSEDSYWAEPSALKPFLHTWSLSIEEQFYILFPISILLLWKFARKYILGVFLLVGVLSLLFAEFFTPRAPEFTFFLLPARGWEFLAGALLAKIELNNGRPVHPVFGKISPAVGICLIAYSIVSFSAETKHPSMLTLIPVLGTMLLIWFSHQGELVTDILRSKIAVGIGLISYSLYLWHYPIFAFSRMKNKMPTPYDKIAWIFLAFSLSIATFFLIEKPFRDKKVVTTKLCIGVFTVFLLPLITFNSGIYLTEGYPKRLGFNPELLSSFDRGNPDSQCQDSKLKIHGVEWCVFGEKDDSIPIDYILIGDSHAISEFVLLDNLGKRYKRRGIYAQVSGCPPLLDIYPKRGPVESTESILCNAMNTAAFEFASSNPDVTVFLVSRWDYYVDGLNLGEHNYISFQKGDFSKEGSRKVFGLAVKSTFERYGATQAKLVLLLQPPHQRFEPKECYKKALDSFHRLQNIPLQIQNVIAEHSISLTEHQNRQRLANEFIREAAEGYHNIHIIDPTPVFCENICVFGDSFSSFYFDDNHLSLTGSNLLSDLFAEHMR